MKNVLKSIALAVLLLPTLALAHKASDSYLRLDLSGTTLTGQWDIALRDLEHAIGLDRDGDGAITWGELKARHPAIADYALARLRITTDGRECDLTPTEQLVDRHSDGSYTVLRFGSTCLSAKPLRLSYQLLFDLDPSHRGLLQVNYADNTQTAVLAPEQARIELQAGSHSLWPQFVDYWREGVWHIWIGFDHILFLLALLLPTVLWRVGHRWHQAVSLREVLINVSGIVTAFTLAHSITLSIAVLGWVSLPSRWVESAIAATVILAALNNVFPLIQGRRWLIAFGLGLIHGFGFASVLADLGLPGDALAIALIGFNLGVETGQLAIVLGFLPLAYGLRGTWFYRRAALQLGSCAVAAVAMLWFIERSFELKLFIL